MDYLTLGDSIIHSKYPLEKSFSWANFKMPAYLLGTPVPYLESGPRGLYALQKLFYIYTLNSWLTRFNDYRILYRYYLFDNILISNIYVQCTYEATIHNILLHYSDRKYVSHLNCLSHILSFTNSRNCS